LRVQALDKLLVTVNIHDAHSPHTSVVALTAGVHAIARQLPWSQAGMSE